MPPFSFDWIEAGRLLACSFPETDADIAQLGALGVTAVVNLDEAPSLLDVSPTPGLTTLHLPVPDFTPPPPAALAQIVAFVQSHNALGEAVAVHCRGGLGRTGTAMACILVSRGATADAAIARIRAQRPGSIETIAQEEAVRAFAAQLDHSRK
ncbi:MAG TPA: dual specificity protein phosphatase family protein [Thermomicrobiales bacterium]|nr:dual specificity protein phosphatase family protein [Thermomicrobiales bacterium]